MFPSRRICLNLCLNWFRLFVRAFAHATVMQRRGGEYISEQSGSELPSLAPHFTSVGSLLNGIFLEHCCPASFASHRCCPAPSSLPPPERTFISVPPVHPWPAPLLFHLIYPLNWKCDCYSTYLTPAFYFLRVLHSDSPLSACPSCLAKSFHKHTLINRFCFCFFSQLLPRCHLATTLAW